MHVDITMGVVIEGVTQVWRWFCGGFFGGHDTDEVREGCPRKSRKVPFCS